MLEYNFEISGPSEPEFYNWFISEKSSIVRNNMIQSVRKEAQLGDPPEKFYNNASECINNVLKLKVDRKSQSLPEFVDHTQELVSKRILKECLVSVVIGDW